MMSDIIDEITDDMGCVCNDDDDDDDDDMEDDCDDD